MPLICVHMSVAEAAFRRLGLPQLEEHLGAFILGATAPDRRILTGQPRQETHYFRLTQDGEGDGVRGLFLACPELRKQEGLSWRDRAFVAGYLSHLAADEAWIVRVYRPYFGNLDSLGADPHHNILDRALQYDLDRQELGQREKMALYKERLTREEAPLGAAFVDAVALARWRDFAINATTREATWQRFEGFIRRYRSDPGIDETEVAYFLSDPPAMLERVFQAMPRRLLTDVREHSIEATVRAAREYLL